MFEELEPRAADPLLDTIRQFRAEPRPHKLDLGVGVFQDESGRTPVLNSAQQAKTYLGAEGDVEYARLLGTIALGPLAGEARVVGLQAPGGTGALRLGG